MNKKSSLQKIILQKIVKQSLPILKRNGVVKAGIFGSYARGEQKKDSDFDLLIQLKGRKSLLDVVGLQLDLQKKLKRKVDLVEYEELHPYLKKQIFSEEVRIL